MLAELQVVDELSVKRFLHWAALTCVLLWIVSGVFIALYSVGVARGHAPTWLHEQALPQTVLGYLRAAAMLICWIGSIYVWARVPRTGLLHGAALVGLIFLGMVVGPFYILISERLLHEAPSSTPVQPR
jgi:hypothetical protein